jgi:hypothetical protein
MPLPIAHSAAGLAGYLVFRKKNPDSSLKHELFLVGLCLFLANLPDLDFIPGFYVVNLADSTMVRVTALWLDWLQA